jgi:hypothetical protein
MSQMSDEERDYALSEIPDDDAEAGADRFADWQKWYGETLADVVARRAV